jgi:hypothetical protein
MSSASQRQSFRPSVEALEDRCVMASFTFLGPTAGPGELMAARRMAGKEPVYFFAVDFQGPSTSSNAAAVWDVAGKEPGGALTGNPVPLHTGKNHHLLIGWYSPDEPGGGGWLAADFAGVSYKNVDTGGVLNPGNRLEAHTFSTWYTNGGHRGVHKQGFITQTWEANGNRYQITMTIAPQEGGRIQAYFTPPALIGGAG